MIPLAHRIVLTENCNKSCPHCFNADQRHGQNMDTQKLFSFWLENRNWLKNAELKLMGGEPTMHPEFLSVADIGIMLFGKVYLFTNGSNLQHITHPDILAAHWTGKFQFIINGYTFNLHQWNDCRKYYKNIQLHFVMPDKNPDAVINKIKHITNENSPSQVHFVLSGDTQVNLFEGIRMMNYRKKYMHAIKMIVPRLKGLGYSYSFDHIFPSCFWTPDMIADLHSSDIEPIHLQRQSCCDKILGLLDTNFDLWYCNQTRLKIGNVFVKGKPRKMEEIHRMLRDMPALKQKALPEKCERCLAVTTCKSACWFIHTQRD